MKLRLSALALDERGTSLIEFGFLAPFLALLTLGVIDLSRGLAARFQLQQAVSLSLELVQARPPVATGGSTEVNYDFVKTEAQTAAGTDATVTMSQWLECDGLEMPDEAYKLPCEDGEDEARYLRIHIAKDFHGDFYFETIPMSASGALRIQ